jgi:hypothetical protein
VGLGEVKDESIDMPFVGNVHTVNRGVTDRESV